MWTRLIRAILIFEHRRNMQPIAAVPPRRWLPQPRLGRHDEHRAALGGDAVTADTDKVWRRRCVAAFASRARACGRRDRLGTERRLAGNPALCAAVALCCV